MSEKPPKRSQVSVDELTWTTPRQVEPGEMVLAHMMWTPFPEYGTDWVQPPDEPADMIYGFWSPIPRVYMGVLDPLMDACSVFAEGVVNLFQEHDDYCVITVMDMEWRFPWEAQFMIAKALESE